ncbi:MAG: nuclear transport factor 2 family protein [Aphanothece sp. CMT-3BRIN-NPC111]|jgi:steroid delta-isomerase|nr:nuclear transport factor 2 family protein [Aphanothece sp. CMT-3BRIN-NPC111]
MSPEAIEKVVAAYFTNMEAMNPDGWVENFAEDAITYDPVGNPPSKVHEDYQNFFGLLKSAFEKLEISKDNVFIAGNSAAVKWTMRVVGRNGKNATTEGISVFEINDAGKIQQVSAYWNEAHLMSQLKG